MRINTNFTPRPHHEWMINPNYLELAAGDLNTQWYARSDINPTTFIKPTKRDLLAMIQLIGTRKGFNNEELYEPENDYTYPLEGHFMNAQQAVPRDINGNILGYGGGNNLESSTLDDKYYFYRGVDTADCIQYLQELGII